MLIKIKQINNKNIRLVAALSRNERNDYLESYVFCSIFKLCANDDRNQYYFSVINSSLMSNKKPKYS